jgi:hypothetical protein
VPRRSEQLQRRLPRSAERSKQLRHVRDRLQRAHRYGGLLQRRVRVRHRAHALLEQLHQHRVRSKQLRRLRNRVRFEFDLPQQRLLASMINALALALSLGAAELLSGDYRAVMLEVGQHRQFRVPKLETITGSSGRCLEEGMDSEEPESIWIEASCAGVRTSLVWKTDGTRVHVMACAEDPETRTPAQLKLRQKVQAELKGSKTVTACVRNGKVELWGWVRTDAEAAQLAALEKKHGLDQLRSFAEKIQSEE